MRRKKVLQFSKAPDGKQGLRLIAQLVRSTLHAQRSTLLGLGIACPGSVDEEGVVLADSPNLIGWKGTNIKQPLEKIFKIPVLIDNDANLAAWGEKCWGVGKNARNLIMLTLGTGIGGGIIINNQIYRGSHFYAGEIGHMKILPDGPKCSCGQKGCLEALASAPAIVQRYNTKTLKRYNVNTARDVFDKASGGDKIACEVVQETAHYLGISLASLINIFDPDVIIIGGGIAKAGNILFKPLRKVVRKNIMPHSLRRPAILPARLGEDAGLLGAAGLVLNP
ncbi:MAG: ROK family protein [Planctomycetota bacterium]|nr:ROK family protein [Planctomycetota bacterium]